MKVYVIFCNYFFKTARQTFSSFCTLHHPYSFAIALLIVCLFFILSHAQCCVQLVHFPVVVCVLHVHVIHFKRKKGRSSALPALLEHPLWPREPSMLLIVSKGQSKSAQVPTVTQIQEEQE